jgi:hypothetical protein
MFPINSGTLVALGSPPKNFPNTFPVVVASGPLTLQPHTMPFRIVLLAYADGTYSVHSEIFSNLQNNESSYSHGDYFGETAEEFIAATRKFAQRMVNHADSFTSLFREGKK